MDDGSQAKNKIKYSLNLLPSILKDEESSVELLDAILEYAEEDLEIFESVILL